MKIDILTIFPAMFKGPLTESLIGKAVGKEIIKINITDVRSFSKDSHKKVDDKPFGGGGCVGRRTYEDVEDDSDLIWLSTDLPSAS